MEDASNIPYAFECPICNHFPIQKLNASIDGYYCRRCNQELILTESLFEGLVFLWDDKKKKMKVRPANAFARIPGKTRQRGERIFVSLNLS